MKKTIQFTKRIFVAVTVCIMAYAIIYQACTTSAVVPNTTTSEFSTVAITQSLEANASDIDQSEVLELVREAVTLAGGFESLVTGVSTIVLKPNLVIDIDYCKPNWDGYPLSPTVNGCTTDWRVTHAVAKLIREINTTCTIYILEGGVGDTEAFFNSLDYINNFSDITNGVTFIELEDQTIFEDVQLADSLYSSNKTYHLEQIYKTADVLISIPVLKNHWNAVVSGAVKNVGIGGVPAGHADYGNTYRGAFIDHSSIRLHQWIRDWYKCRPVDYVVMDGLQSVQNGPTPSVEVSGTTNLADDQKNMRCILAGSDAIAVDTIESLVMNWDPTSVEYLKLLGEDGLGHTNTANIHVVGKSVADVRTDFAGVLNLQSYGGAKITDTTAPTITINSHNLLENSLDLNLSAGGDVHKVEILVNEQLLTTMTGGFRQVTVDLSGISAINLTVSAVAYDYYMNSTSDSVTVGNGTYIVKETLTDPTIDGIANDACWDTVAWTPINRLWYGAVPSAADFTGKIKIVWKGNILYVLGKITDDVLNDAHTSGPTSLWWEDDCFEVFIDENKSGGDHEQNENAYAYHCAIDGINIVDLDNTGNPVLYNSHINYDLVTTGTTTYWELAITVYDDTLTPIAPMSAGKEIGLSVAYCDNDGTTNDGSGRQSFIGTTLIDNADLNVSWQNADWFGSLLLQ